MRKKISLRSFIFALSFLLVSTVLHAETQKAGASPSQVETAPTSGVFRLHIPTEPHSLDPSVLTSTEGSYFFYSVMRGLYSYTNENGLKPENAEVCRFEKPLKMVCIISKKALWSDGTQVTSEDYARAFKRLLNSDSKNASGVELLKNVKNAVAVHGGKKPLDQLGIKTEGNGKLILEFENPDPDFLYKLTSSVLSPVHSSDYGHPNEFAEKKVLFNGPYKIKEWLVGKRVRLEPNPFYKKGFAGRPPVEILFIDEDQTALNLYDQGTLTFLRRLSTSLIPKYKNHPDFYQIPMARFDYVGFGDELKDQPDLRAALSYSADFTELQKLYDALGMPGCPALAETLLDQPRCLKFDLKKAKDYWAKVPDEIRKRRPKFMFSMLGGDDVKKGAEWFQAQWKKNLGFNVDLEQVEYGVMMATLRKSPPPIFRKGIGLERPTCLAALEKFASNGPENFLHLEDSAYQAVVKKMTGLSQPSDLRKACGEGVQYLLDHHLLIPLGRIHFTLLASTKFEGWHLNEMNQLDLADLKTRP